MNGEASREPSRGLKGGLHRRADSSRRAPSGSVAAIWWRTATGIWLILAARMKSFSVRPLTAWVDSAIVTLR